MNFRAKNAARSGGLIRHAVFLSIGKTHLVGHDCVKDVVPTQVTASPPLIVAARALSSHTARLRNPHAVYVESRCPESCRESKVKLYWPWFKKSRAFALFLLPRGYIAER